MNYHGKVYTNSQEGEDRYRIFQRNLKHITETNSKRSKSSDFRLGLNKFADISVDEFRDMYLHQIEMPETLAAGTTITSKNTMQKKISCAAPPTLDWRRKGVVTPVKNQNKCGTFVWLTNNQEFRHYNLFNLTKKFMIGSYMHKRISFE